MRRFDTPAAPPGWDGRGAELLRIMDPTGRAIAWLAPALGASCVGYAVRHDGPGPGGWRQVLHAGSPREVRDEPLAYGCAILGPEATDRGSAHRESWRFVERDPTAATCAVRCGEVLLDLTARLEDRALHLDLRATSEGGDPAPVALGVRLCLADGFQLTTQDATDGQSVVGGDGLALGLLSTLGCTLAHHWHAEHTSRRPIVEIGGAATSTTILAPGGELRLAVVIVPG